VTGCGVPPCGAFLCLLMAAPFDPHLSTFRCEKCGREFQSANQNHKIPCAYCDGIARRIG
jgi:transposase-like protein